MISPSAGIPSPRGGELVKRAAVLKVGINLARKRRQSRKFPNSNRIVRGIYTRGEGRLVVHCGFLLGTHRQMQDSGAACILHALHVAALTCRAQPWAVASCSTHELTRADEDRVLKHFCILIAFFYFHEGASDGGAAMRQDLQM